jgi:hypothetical protein
VVPFVPPAGYMRVISRRWNTARPAANAAPRLRMAVEPSR